MPVVISDSSTLIHLAGIGRLELLKFFFGAINIPPAVWREVVKEGKKRAGAVEVNTAKGEGWIKIIKPNDLDLIKILKNDLDDGEAEAIALAVEKKADLILLDEMDARRVADIYLLPKTGVIGILMRAKMAGKIESLRRGLDDLRDQGGFWISESIYVKALQMVGEDE